MQKGHAGIIVLIIALILAGLAGAYYFGKVQNTKSQIQNPVVISPTPQPTITPSASPDETANWKTYKNSKFGVSFKYPSEWYVAEQQGSVYINNVPIPSVPLTHGLPQGIQINISSSLPDFNPPWKQSSSDITLDGVSGTKVMDQEPDRSDEIMRTRITIKQGGLYYQIIFSNTDNQGNHNPVFDQILSTFKFP